jgi:hypothetical protein
MRPCSSAFAPGSSVPTVAKSRDMRLALTPIGKTRTRAKNKGAARKNPESKESVFYKQSYERYKKSSTTENHKLMMTALRALHKKVVGAPRKNPGHRDAYAYHRSVTADLQRADDLLESFSGRRASKELRVSQPQIKTGLVIGPMTGVMYAADRGDGVHEYCHRFRKQSRPLLITDSDGNQLGIVGGRFRFTDRGITDK